MNKGEGRIKKNQHFCNCNRDVTDPLTNITVFSSKSSVTDALIWVITVATNWWYNEKRYSLMHGISKLNCGFIVTQNVTFS